MFGLVWFGLVWFAPVRELDDRQIGIGSRGPITEQVQDAYFDAVRGANVPHKRWLTIVE